MCAESRAVQQLVCCSGIDDVGRHEPGWANAEQMLDKSDPLLETQAPLALLLLSLQLQRRRKPRAPLIVAL